MRSLLKSELAVLFAAVWLGACSSSAGGGKPADAAVESANESTCQDIRICVAYCSDADQVCAQACVARGSSQGKALFQALVTCTSGFCAAGDFNCACQQQCFADGNCLAEVDTCVAGAVEDLACMFCR